MAITAQTSKQALLDLVNTDNTTTFTLAQVALAAPVAAGGTGGRNSTVKITGVDAVALPGEVTVSYTRQAGSTVFAAVRWEHEFSKDAAVAADVVTEIETNVLPGLPVPFEAGSYAITATALASSEPESEDGKYNWTVSIDLSNHYVLNGTVTILVNSNKVSLSDITVTDLNGFTSQDVSA